MGGSTAVLQNDDMATLEQLLYHVPGYDTRVRRVSACSARINSVFIDKCCSSNFAVRAAKNARDTQVSTPWSVTHQHHSTRPV